MAVEADPLTSGRHRSDLSAKSTPPSELRSAVAAFSYRSGHPGWTESTACRSQANGRSEGLILYFSLRVGRLEQAERVAARGASVCVVEGSSDDQGFLKKMTRQGEEAIGRFAQELLENPVVSGALSAAMETRERAMRAQEAALAALNLPSAADLERLTRRLRSVSQRLEGVEDVLDRVERRVQALDDVPLETRLAEIEASLARIEEALAARSVAAESS